MYGLLPFTNPAAPTGNPVFDRIFHANDLTIASMVLCLTAWFVVWFYGGCALARLILPQQLDRKGLLRVSVHEWRLGAALLVGLLLTLYSFSMLGDNLLNRYANLILYRSQSELIPRTALNATAFSLTQIWSWLAVVALLYLFERKGRRWLKAAVIVLLAVFAVLGVSRRALFLPVLMAYLGLLLYSGRWRLRWLVACSIPAILWLAFGKELLGAVAFGVPVDAVAGRYESLPSALLRAVSELGITIVESLGTMAFLSDHLRLGVDHVLSIAQRLPDGILGLDIDWPQRMVRISTEAFAGHDDLDIPPGLAGQMWLDFRLLGPIAWGLVFGLQVGAAQWLFERTRRTLASSALAVLVIFVASLPVNSGSFDFTFSFDIIILMFLLWWCFDIRRPVAVRHLPTESAPRAPPGLEVPPPTAVRS